MALLFVKSKARHVEETAFVAKGEFETLSN